MAERGAVVLGRVLAVVLPTALVLAGCGGDDEPDPDPDGREAPSLVGPCGVEMEAQQVATDLAPDTPAAAGAEVDGGIGVGLLEDGICVDLTAYATEPGWRVTSLALEAGRRGETWRWSTDGSNDDALDNGGQVVVPVRGCVRVTAAADVRGPDGATGTWSLAETYGFGCRRAPGGPGGGLD